MARNNFSLEQRIEALERKYTTLYQRAYARNIRRADLYEQENNRIKNWIKRMDGLPVRRLAVLCTKLKQGKRLALLNRNQEIKLYRFLGKWGNGVED